MTRHIMTWGPGPKTLVRVLRMQTPRVEVPGESAYMKPWWERGPPWTVPWRCAARLGFPVCRLSLSVGLGLVVHTFHTPSPLYIVFCFDLKSSLVIKII